MWETPSGRTPILDYLDSILKHDETSFVNLTTHLSKLSEHGQKAFCRELKPMTFREISPPYKLVRIKTGTKPYRLYAILTPKIVHTLVGKDKKRNDLEKKTRELIISRAKQVILQENDL